MQTGRRAGPPPPAPRGDGPAPKESLRRARARARPQSTVLAWRPKVLGGASIRNSGRGSAIRATGSGAGIPGSTQIRRGGRGAHVKDRGGGALSTSCGGAAGNPEKVNQLVLQGDHGPGGGDSFLGRGGGVFDQFAHRLGRAPESQDHLAGQGGPSDPHNRLTPRRPSRQRPMIHLGQFIFQRRHGMTVHDSTPISTNVYRGFLENLILRC